jgi:hypothetical protein
MKEEAPRPGETGAKQYLFVPTLFQYWDFVRQEAHQRQEASVPDNPSVYASAIKDGTVLV